MPQTLERTRRSPSVRTDALFAEAMRQLQAGQLAAAGPLFTRCIGRDPGHAEAHVHLGEVHRQTGDLMEALACCDRGLGYQPSLASGRLIRGIVRRDLKQHAGAAEDLRIAAAHFPHAAAIHAVLGFALSESDLDDEAIEALERASALDPRMPDVHRVLGDLYQASGRTPEALKAYQVAVDIKPDDAVAFGNLARLVFGIGDFALTVALCQTAVRLMPALVEVHCYLGAALRMQGKTPEAIAAYREALAHDPSHVEALSKLCILRRQACDWEGLDRDDAAVRALVLGQGKHVAPFAILVSTPVLADNLQCARLWAQSLEPASGERLAPYAEGGAGEPSRRLRIGYISADFHTHATATLIVEMLELHDRASFELFAYSLGPDDGSPMRRRLVASFDRFVDLRSAAHRDAALRIHADDIDILIDLKGYTGNARTEIVAYRPAPIQVNFLGYPGTMGAGFIDYIIGDAIVTPLAHQAFYDEKIVQLPHCYQPNDRKRLVDTARVSRAHCGLPEKGFVFCCFNNSYKITPAMFDVWMRLLHAVPASVLWLLESDPCATGNLHREALARGIPKERVVFAPKLAIEAHLARLNLADLFLDTLPVNAHTTASEALWAGLPVLTCIGETFIGRVAASLLLAAGLPELVTTSLAAYEATALQLARDPLSMAGLRDRLSENLATMPLFDTDRYVRNFETALRRMARLRTAGRLPEAFAVAVDASSR